MNSWHKPARRSPRMSGYDYTRPGAYFVTICTLRREWILGDVVGGVMVLNPSGEIVKSCWLDLPTHYPYMTVDCFVVMPNHTHAIIVQHKIPPTHKKHGLPEYVRALKSFSARGINQREQTTGFAIWQRSFHDHIIRDEAAMTQIRDYIHNNPARWEEDSLYRPIT